ncbi:hypothetical protein ACFLTH_04720 [Bacteroidota bacterium]
MTEMQQRIMMCYHGDCVDVTKIKCDAKFDNIDEIIECEQMQAFANETVKM